MTRIGDAIIPCPRCGFDLPALCLEPGGAACYNCETPVQATVFGAAFRKSIVTQDAPVEIGDASCFFHPDRTAVSPCSHCGRFLCNLCRIDWSGSSLCINCIETFQKTSKSSFLSATRFHYDSLALALATVPALLFVSPTIFTSPVALGMVLFTYRKQTSITPRSKWRFILAGTLALVEIGGWTWLIIYSVMRTARLTS